MRGVHGAPREFFENASFQNRRGVYLELSGNVIRIVNAAHRILLRNAVMMLSLAQTATLDCWTGCGRWAMRRPDMGETWQQKSVNSLHCFMPLPVPISCKLLYLPKHIIIIHQLVDNAICVSSYRKHTWSASKQKGRSPSELWRQRSAKC